MSNHFGLMFSFIFLCLFVMFSGEVISYQCCVAKTMAITNELAIYVQENGYNKVELISLKCCAYLDNVKVTQEKDTVNNITTYTIITDKKHPALTNIYQFMETDFQCKMVVCRKENNG